MVGAAVRYRRKLVDMCADEVRRLQKVLEGGNIKLGDPPLGDRDAQVLVTTRLGGLLREYSRAAA